MRPLRTAGPRSAGASRLHEGRVFSHLVAPLRPARARLPREQLQVRTRTTALDEVVELIRLARVFALERTYQVDLPPARGERAQAAAYAEQQQLGHVAEVKAHASPIRPPVLAGFEP